VLHSDRFADLAPDEVWALLDEGTLGVQLVTAVGIEGKWPVLGRHERAAEWQRIWADLGRAPRTIDAYVGSWLSTCRFVSVTALTRWLRPVLRLLRSSGS
jgi:hypothetical protein